MRWAEYYSKFYDWSYSTQKNRISSLTEFTSNVEICDVIPDLDEPEASELVLKALSQQVVFTSAQITDICEFVDEEALAGLMSTCTEQFTANQLENINDYGAGIEQIDIKSVNFNNSTWSAFYNIFYDLSDKEKIRGAMAINDFSATGEVIEIIFELASFKEAENFIFKALDSGLVLSFQNIEELIEFDNKSLNRRLVFENINLLKKHIAIDEFDYLENYMYRQDFIKLKKMVGYIKQPPDPKPVKIGFFTQIVGGILGAKLLKHIFEDDEE